MQRKRKGVAIRRSPRWIEEIHAGELGQIEALRALGSYR